MLITLENKDFDKMYDIMKVSFPKDEFRPYDGQKALLKEDAYRIYAYPDHEGDRIKGFVTVWEYENIAFLEHLAVNPTYRNGGIGSTILKELADKIQKMLCLEVELPETEIAKRRIGFYERNGYFLNEYPYLQPALAEGQEPVPLLIMTTRRPINDQEFEEIKHLLYSKVYKVY